MDQLLELIRQTDELLAQAEKNIHTIQRMMDGMDPDKKLGRLATLHRNKEEHLTKLKKTLLEYLVRLIFDLAPHSVVGRYRIESYTEVRQSIQGLWEAGNSQPIRCILGSPDWIPFHIFCGEAINRIAELFKEVPERQSQEIEVLSKLGEQLNKLAESC